MLAHAILVLTQPLALDGAAAISEPKRVRYRIPDIAEQINRHARRTALHLPVNQPWAGAILRVQAPRHAPRLPLTAEAGRAHHPSITGRSPLSKLPTTRGRRT